MPALDYAVIGGALVHMCGHHQIVLLDPRLAPQLDHIAAPVRQGIKLAHDHALDRRRAIRRGDFVRNGLQPLDGNIGGAGWVISGCHMRVYLSLSNRKIMGAGMC